MRERRQLRDDEPTGPELAWVLLNLLTADTTTTLIVSWGHHEWNSLHHDGDQLLESLEQHGPPTRFVVEPRWSIMHGRVLNDALERRLVDGTIPFLQQTIDEIRRCEEGGPTHAALAAIEEDDVVELPSDEWLREHGLTRQTITPLQLRMLRSVYRVPPRRRKVLIELEVDNDVDDGRVASALEFSTAGEALSESLGEVRLRVAGPSHG